MDGKIVQQPIQIVIQGQGPTRSLRSRPSAKVKAERLKKLFPARIVGVLASMQVVFFLSAATIQAAMHITVSGTTSGRYKSVDVGGGFWMGVFFAISGFLGLFAVRAPSQCRIIGFMVMSIISSLVCGALIFYAAIGLSQSIIHRGVVSSRYRECREDWYGDGGCDIVNYSAKCHYDGGDCPTDANAIPALFATLIVIAILEFGTGIVSAVYCCRAACDACCGGSEDDDPDATVIYDPVKMGSNPKETEAVEAVEAVEAEDEPAETGNDLDDIELDKTESDASTLGEDPLISNEESVNLFGGKDSYQRFS